MSETTRTSSEAVFSRPRGERVAALVVLAVLVSSVGVGAAGAATCPDGAVTPTTTTSWFTAANWSNGQVPDATTQVCIDTAVTVTVEGADADAASVTITDAAAVLRLQPTSTVDASLGVVGDVDNAGLLELRGFVVSNPPESHLVAGGTLLNSGTLRATGGSGGTPQHSVTATAIHNLGILEAERNLVLDATTITSSGTITSANTQRLTVRSTGAADGPDVTVPGSITSLTTTNPSTNVTWEQTGGSLDLTGATLTRGLYTLPGVEATVAHDATGTDAVPSFRVTGGSVHLDPDAGGANLIFHAENTLTGGAIGASHRVELRGLAGGIATTVTVPGDLDNDGELGLPSSGGGSGPSHVVVEGTLTNRGLIHANGTPGTSVTAGTFDSPGTIEPNSALIIDTATFTSSGAITSPFNGAALRVRSTLAPAGPDATITDSVVMPGNSARYEQEGGTLQVADGSFQLGAGVWLTDIEVSAEGDLGSRLDLFGTSVLSPGSSPGVLDVATLYRHLSGDTTLAVELGGTAPGSYDQVNAGGAATLAGTLAIDLIDDFVPAPCDTFDVVTSASRSGTFATVTGATLGGGLELVPAYRNTGLRLIAGASADDVQVFPTALVLDETAPSQTYSICLTRQPSADVTITPTVFVGDVTVQPDELTFTPADWQDPQTVTVTGLFDDPAGDRQATITHEATSGDASYHGTDVATVDVTLLDDDPTEPAADLAVTKTADVADAEVGDTVTYTLTVTNAGPDPASGVVLSDTLPSGMTFGSANDSCVHASGTVTCDIGTLLVDATEQRSITVVAATVGSKVNSVVVTADQADPDASNDSDTATVVVTSPGSNGDQTVERVSGTTRIDTSVAISQETYDAADTVVIARADDYADALAGAPLAVNEAAPLLLTNSDGLFPAVGDEIERLGATTAILMGGEAALSAQVEADLTAMGVTPDRIAGSNRYDTAVQVAARLPAYDEVVIAEGDNLDGGRGWPDALTGASFAAGQGLPVLLVTQDILPPETAGALDDDVSATIMGGSFAVSDQVADQIAALSSSTERLFGTTRYTTALAIADEAEERGLSVATTWVATGRNWPDALGAAAATGAAGGVMLLVDGDVVEGSLEPYEWLEERQGQVQQAYIAGGTEAVSDEVLQAVADAIGAVVVE